jgi:hypothetical protein
MKFFKKILFLIGIAICGHSQIFTINLKQMICAGLVAKNVTSDCTVYNTMKQDVIIQNSRYGIFKHTVPLSTVKIAAGGSQDIDTCIALDIISEINEDIKIIGLSYDDQPRGEFTAFTLSQGPCSNDCQGAMTQIILSPGLPESYLLSLPTLSSKELSYVAHQLKYNSNTVTHTCNLRGYKKKQVKKY